MHRIIHRLYLLSFVLLFSLLGCDPLAPVASPTPQVIIITAVPSATPTATLTPEASRTPIPSPTIPITPSPTPMPCLEDGGQVRRVDRFFSETAEENLRYRVYVPPCYEEAQKRYPYVILLHGAGSTEAQWDDLGVDEALDQGIALGAIAPMIVVMPFTGSIGNENVFPPDPSYETVLLEEVIPAIERNFCTWNNREHRAIGGISRGGFWAYSIALRHPDGFSAVGGHSAFFPEDIIPPEFDPLNMALNSTFLPDAKLRMYFDNGANDYASVSLELFSSRLSARAIPHTYVINPVGEHNNDYWAAHVEEYLAFYAEEWPRDLDELPTCQEPSP